MKTHKFNPLIMTEVTDWMREMWEVEAQHSPMVGSRLKIFPPPANAPQPKQRKVRMSGRKLVKAV
jgi:hypothetical protein